MFKYLHELIVQYLQELYGMYCYLFLETDTRFAWREKIFACNSTVKIATIVTSCCSSEIV